MAQIAEPRLKQLSEAQNVYRERRKKGQFIRLQAWIPKEASQHLKKLCVVLGETQAEVITKALSELAKECEIIKKAGS